MLNWGTDTGGSGDDNKDVKVNEKAAIKKGCSVKTARADTGRAVQMRSQLRFAVDTTRESKCITVYLREKFWLQARSIIDGDGNLWKPTVHDDAPVDLTEENNGNGDGGEPARKKGKLEVVNLTLVKDSIDLTAC